MRAIDAGLLRGLAQGGDRGLIGLLAPLLACGLPAAGIGTALRVAHFLAQAVYETGYLTRLSENLAYSAARIARVWPRLAPRAQELAGNPEALANAAYAGRNGNGVEASGDGWRFRGRGLLDLTGRANYAALGCADDPDALAKPQAAVESAIRFWTMRGVNCAADEDSIAEVTRLVTGCAEGMTARALIKHRALAMLEPPQT